MYKITIIALLMCLVLTIGSVGCVGSKSSAESTSSFHPTVSEVIKLLEADIEEDIILSYIANRQLPPILTADDIIGLTNEGATQVIIAALQTAPGNYPGNEFPFELDESHTVGQPITHGALAVFPIFQETDQPTDVFLTLDEASKLNVITIREKNGGSVPYVIIENTGNRPVYICGGEVIFGGKQDRMISHDVVIAPREAMEVKVKCVESGRWSGSTSHFSSSGFMGSTKVREAVQFMSQSDVWNRVAEQNADLDTQNSTGSYRAALTHEEIQELYKVFSQTILPQLEGDDLVGMIIAVNGEILCIDIFGSSSLFGDLKEKILKSSVLDIIGVEDEGTAPPSKVQILDFYQAAIQAESEELQRYQKNANNMRDSEDALVNESVDDHGQLYHQNIVQKQINTYPQLDQVPDSYYGFETQNSQQQIIEQ